ncbi:hypothetical protein [Pseudomonas moorei]|uniref:hypothetical protein n=1 Tax=Pseudomonas moorei TaxID=395599 RepID=UPI001FF2A6E7|nr:hypothetical protein [Pseudomonas moorei]
MKTTATISAAQDARNCRIIRVSMSNFLSYRSAHELQLLLEHGTPEQRAAHVQQYRRRILFWAFALMVAGSLIVLSRNPQVTPPPSSGWVRPAGAIEHIELHETAFSTTTTVVTAEGNFQVRGAVSAAIGNPVALKKEKASAGGERVSICITSAIKSACYQLL